MAHRSFSVLVLPERWEGSAGELARRLAPVTRQSSDRLSEALERGPVTLDADLRLEEARRIAGQLERLSAPVEIRDASGEVVDTFGPDEASGGAAVEDSTTENAPEEQEFSERDDFDVVVDEIFEDETSASWDLEEVEASAEPSTQEAPEADSAEEVATWGDLLDDERGDGIGAQEGEGEETDEGESSGADAVLEFTPGDLTPSGSDGGAEREDSSSRGASDADPGASVAPAFDVPDGAAPDGPEERSGGAKTAREADSGPRSSFDGERIEEVFEGEEGAEFGANDTYEDRPAHVPIVAALLSAFAPGAGQVYNGDAEEAWSFAGRAVLLRPWFESVREAFESGRAIRDGERPRPEEGSFGRALGHLAVLYLGLAGLVLFCWFGWRAAVGFRGSPGVAPSKTATEADEPVAAALHEATFLVHEARLAGWERTGPGPVEREERFSMNPRERAARLFEIGLEYCRARKYDMCETTMHRVANISETYRRDAYRLQVWANVQRDPNAQTSEMPRVRTGGDGGSRSRDATQGRRPRGDAGPTNRPEP